MFNPVAYAEHQASESDLHAYARLEEEQDRLYAHQLTAADIEKLRALRQRIVAEAATPLIAAARERLRTHRSSSTLRPCGCTLAECPDCDASYLDERLRQLEAELVPPPDEPVRRRWQQQDRFFPARRSGFS